MDLSKVLEHAPALEAQLAPMIAAGAMNAETDQVPAARALVAAYAPALATLPPFLLRILAAIAQALLEHLER